ncbi:MAB_1171c family putative transporter [Streptomyces sp. NPDC005017]|uniref:MAB_1171c family putative transporter n=1 Tax=Streptomyces sp. NPDC005017 TaxID=3364706 RepID=UPI00368B198C
MSPQEKASIGTALLGAGLLAFEVWWLRGSRTFLARAMWTCVGFAALAFVCDVPSFSEWAGEASGVPNISRLGAYAFALGSVGSAQILALAWRFPLGEVRRRLRRLAFGWGAVILAVVLLFAVSDVPVERPDDFPVAYGHQPSVAALSTVYFSALAAGSLRLTWWMVSWARGAKFARFTWLRIGLILYACETFTLSLWALTGLGCTVPAWFGLGVSGRLYNLGASVLLPLVGVLLCGALLVPVAAPRLVLLRVWLNRWRAFLLLRPLHRRLLAGSQGHVLVAAGKRFDPHHRVRRMVIELNDRWAVLSLFYDPDVRESTERAARERGLPDAVVEALVEAAQLRAAAQGRGDGDGAPRPAAHTAPDSEAVDGSGGVDSELRWWIRVARADRRPLPAEHTSGRRRG